MLFILVKQINIAVGVLEVSGSNIRRFSAIRADTVAEPWNRPWPRSFSTQ